MKLDTPKDYVNYFHTMVSHIENTIKAKHKFKKEEDVPILLEIVDTLEKEMITYDSKRYSFSEFIHAIKEHTKTSTFFGLFSKDSKVKTIHELNDLFKKLMTAIKNVVVVPQKLPERFEDELERKGKEFVISKALSINILNLLINFKLTEKFDTMVFIEKIYPELAKYIPKKDMNPFQSQNRKQNNTRRNKQQNKPQNNTRRNKQQNKQQNKGTEEYPFGATAAASSRIAGGGQ